MAITKEDVPVLKELLASVIAESRKPTAPSEQEQANIEQAQQHRINQRDALLAQMEHTQQLQKLCSHEHSRREGGGTHCVYVREEHPASPGYILCQKCQSRIRPSSARKDAKGNYLDGRAQYDTALFNKLFQDSNEGELLG